jgi:hypothetical protein
MSDADSNGGDRNGNGRQVRFSLRSILIAITLVAVSLVVGARVYDWYVAVPTMPLADAIEAFNSKYAEHLVGKYEPPLTEGEVVAAINGQMSSLPAGSKVKTIYANIARSKQIPVNATLVAIPGFQPSNGTTYTVWWINLDVQTAKYSGYGLRIRENNHPAAKPEGQPKLDRNNLMWTSESSR